MRLTTKGRYAVTAMLDLAIYQDNGSGQAQPVSLSDIAERQGISLSYLEQLFAMLRKRGLVRSTRGPRGGYRLNRDTRQIAVADVITAVDESVDATRCGGLENCQGEARCLTHDLWHGLSEQIHEFLSGIDLEQLVANHRGRQPSAGTQGSNHANPDKAGSAVPVEVATA